MRAWRGTDQALPASTTASRTRRPTWRRALPTLAWGSRRKDFRTNAAYPAWQPAQYSKDGFHVLDSGISAFGCFQRSASSLLCLLHHTAQDPCRPTRKEAFPCETHSGGPLRSCRLPSYGNTLQSLPERHGGEVRLPGPMRHGSSLCHRVFSRTAQQDVYDCVSFRLLRLRRGELLRVLLQGTAHSAL